MAAKTGNTYICGTITDRIEAATANLGFLTKASSIKVRPNNFDNDRHPEIKYSGFGANLAILR